MTQVPSRRIATMSLSVRSIDGGNYARPDERAPRWEGRFYAVRDAPRTTELLRPRP